MLIQIDHQPSQRLSRRAVGVLGRFGVRGIERTQQVGVELPAIGAGEVWLITGASGGGKSSLLREIRRRHRGAWVQLEEIRLPGRCVIDCVGRSADEALRRLSRVGLAEVWTYVRRPAELSEGQRWRLRLAMGLERAGTAASGTVDAPAVLACDEFAAVLDRVTAKVVARMLRRTIDSAGRVSAIVATSHEDLIEALAPDLVVTCDFGVYSTEVFTTKARRHEEIGKGPGGG